VQQVAEKLIRSREYGRAIAYIVQSGDTVRMASVTDALIDEYLSKGSFSEAGCFELNHPIGQEEFAKLVDAIPTRLLRPGTLATEADDPQSRDNYKLFADKIAFLAQYRDFHAFFAQGARLEAAKLLAGMLASGLPPKRFVAVLLLDAVPLLEDSEAHLDASETFELLRCLQEVEMAAEEVAYLAPMGALVAGAGKAHSQQELVAIARQQVKLVRLALARNLSRALIMQ
jgi:nuclear pore complex protein Nup85